MAKQKEDQTQPLSKVLEAAIKAQHQQAEKIQRGGALRVVENLSSADQRTVMGVVNR